MTHEVFCRLLTAPEQVPEATCEEITHLAEQYNFLHWHLAFPDVFRVPADDAEPENEQTGWNGGFDVVLGNPPWERIKLQEKEWFATHRPDIAAASNAAARRQMINALPTEDPALYGAFLEARRQAEGESHLVRASGRYPLCGRGDVNTYTIFAETNRLLLAPTGRVGCIVPSGIATDDTTKYFFQDLMETQSLANLYDFENRAGLFPDVDSRMKFCLLTLTGAHRPAVRGAEFVFFAHSVEDLHDEQRHFTLAAEDLALLTPNTRTCPVFRSKRDAALTKLIYRRVPVLIKEGPPEENPWGIRFSTMFHMSNDSSLFRTREQLEADDWSLDGNVFRRGNDVYLPLYEAKLFHHFDHRWATHDGLDTRDLTSTEKANPEALALPRYWVPADEVTARLADKWRHGWLLGVRGITNTTNERTIIASVLARGGVGNSAPLMLLADGIAPLGGLLVASMSSYVFDFAARFKVGGVNLNFFIINQLPVLPPTTYTQPCPWGSSPTSLLPTPYSLHSWLLPHVLELTYTAWDLAPFAKDYGYDGPPFCWDEERRFLIRCELDAAYFHLYGIARDDVDYVMETFPIVKRKDEAQHGEYRTKRIILEIYDAIQQSIDTGTSYQTRLDPAPGPPAHGLSAWYPGSVCPADWPPHIHRPQSGRRS